MQHLQQPPLFQRKPPPARRWLPDLQRLYLQLQRMQQQDRGFSHSDRRSSFLCLGIVRRRSKTSNMQGRDHQHGQPKRSQGSTFEFRTPYKVPSALHDTSLKLLAKPPMIPPYATPDKPSRPKLLRRSARPLTFPTNKLKILPHQSKHHSTSPRILSAHPQHRHRADRKSQRL